MLFYHIVHHQNTYGQHSYFYSNAKWIDIGYYVDIENHRVKVDLFLLTISQLTFCKKNETKKIVRRPDEQMKSTKLEYLF